MENASQDPIVVIGAGPAGLTAALELSHADREVVVLESDSQYVGGLARTVQYKGNLIDIGGHRYYTKIDEIWDWWHKALPGGFLEVERQSRIYYKERFIRYPLEAWDALSKMGILFSVRALLDYLYRQARPRRPENSFRDWIVNRFGDRLFHVFFESYTEKVWGMSCDEISADWAAQRIQGLSIANVIVRALTPPSLRSNHDASLKTLIDQFHYPRKGCGMLWESVRDQIEEKGNTIELDREVQRIIWQENRVEAVECVDSAGNRNIHACDHLISSMPLRDFIQSMDPAPPASVYAAAQRLRYRDFLTVGLIVKRPKLFTDQWIYIHEPGVKVGRIQNYRNWSPEMVPDPDISFLGMEYFCFEGDGLWTMGDDDLGELARTELEKIGLAAADEVDDWTVVRAPKAYPIYDEGYKEAVAEIRTWLREFENIWSVGRNGTHRYNNQDHSMMTALLVARNLTRQEDHCPWVVNQNAEYLEDRAIPARLEERLTGSDA